jgi:TRAP-type mannitol/chloroaromatic compound transport system permease large subunit
VLLLSLLTLLLVLGLPVVFALVGAGVLALQLQGVVLPWVLLPQRMMQGIASFPLLAVPFFILAAELMNSWE